MEQPPQQDDQRAAVQLRINSDLIEVVPGNSESTSFTVRNQGTQVEQFRCVVTGPEWVVAEPATLTVYPGDEATGAIQANPPRKPSSVAGVTPFRLTVTSVLHAHVSSSVAGRVDVAPYYELAAELVPTSSNGRGLTRHHIELDNRGNVPLRIELTPTDVADGLRLGVPAFADVAPGQVIEVPVSVYATRRWFGRAEPETFSVVAEAPKPLAATRLPGTRIVVPVFPRWVPAVAAGLVAATAIAAILVPKLTAHAAGPSQQSSTGPATSASTGAATSASTGAATSASTGAATSASTGAATSASTATAPVSLPNVTGDTLQQADMALKAVHLVPQYQAFYDSSSPGGTNVVRTNPAAGTAVPPNSTVQVLIPIQHYDMVSGATQAQWTATSQITPPSATLTEGTQTGSAGQVFAVTPATLEDGLVAIQALETLPPPVPGGTITGLYKLPDATIDQEQFRADIGFRNGTPTGQMIQYQVIAIAGGSTSVVLDGIHSSASHQVDSLTKVLPAGTTMIELVVKTLDSTTAQDNIVWVSPRIEEANAPPETILTTPSATPPTSPPTS